MIRTVIHINEELCSGCGLCASACKEGAIAMVNGKARLIRDDYCDGLGNCRRVRRGSGQGTSGTQAAGERLPRHEGAHDEAHRRE